MAKTPDFTRTPVPAPPPAAAGQAAPANMPGEGRPPLNSGTVTMTDYTRRNLEQLGWKEGDPIPGDLGQRIQQIQAEIETERETATVDLPPDFKPPKPKMVDIADLPAEKQAELRQFLADHKEEIQHEQAYQQHVSDAQATLPADAPPSVRQAAADIAKGQMAAGMQTIQATDQAPPASMPVPEGRQLGGVSGVVDMEKKFAGTQPSQPEPAPPPDPQPAPPPSTGAAPGLKTCPRCMWDLSSPFDVDITDRDKETFMASVLGSTRFCKQYPLLGDNMSVIFRSLTPSETAILRKQMRYDLMANRILGEGEYYAELMEYRMLMSVQKIQSKQLPDGVIAEVPEILTIPYTEQTGPDAEAETPLVPLKKWFYEEVVPQEPLQQVLRQKHRHFQRLVEALEALTSEPDFWKGIAPRA